jgi:ABC-type antimicrobial peptide transport system permease subunit
MGLTLAGATLGLVCALIVSHVMARVLYGVKPTDPVTFTSVAVVLVTVALLACYVPAQRAIRIDPVIALKGE